MSMRQSNRDKNRHLSGKDYTIWTIPAEKWSKLPDMQWTLELQERAKRELPKVQKDDPLDSAFRTPVREEDLSLLVD
ncbi:MAG: hypothetical protein HW380_2502 [Magnetococcales bacterium]|nr:hypothetical protein [Magnetococcales bacterium]